MGRAPPRISSAGWKRKTAVPGISRRRAARMSARVRAIAVWPSCAQACITPGVPEAKGASSVSVRGEGVDVRAPGYGVARAVASQHADHARLGHPRAHLEAGGVEAIRDD